MYACVGALCLCLLSLEACLDHGKLQDDQQPNMIMFGKTKKGVQRYRCKTCGKTFTETTGTIFFRMLKGAALQPCFAHFCSRAFSSWMLFRSISFIMMAPF